MEDNEVEPWLFTVVRAQGLRFIRPEKAWRPIVTVEIDKHYCYELVLGIDGQNPNLKDRFAFPEADMNARVEIKVWHEPPSKKKKKKRHLVATSTRTLGELVKRQELEPKIEVQLQCQSQTKKRIVASRGKPQAGASLQLQLRPPPLRQNDALPLRPDSGYSSDSHQSSGVFSDNGTIAAPSSPILAAQEKEDECVDETSPLLGGLRRRRRKQRPYFLDSDHERNYKTEYETDSDSDNDSCTFELDTSKSNLSTADDHPIYIRLPLTNNVLSWIAPSLLPQYTEKIDTPPKSLSLPQRAVASFTMYDSLREAMHESDFDPIFRRLQMEWTYIGGLLVALAAVDTAVFAIAPDSVFNVDSYARLAIAGSSIASGLGIACDAWFLFRYSWADLPTFIYRARDVFDSYFFFSISSRVPALCMLSSSISLMIFLGIVAYDVFPTGVLVVCFLVGMVMTLQFLVYGVHWAGIKVVQTGRKGAGSVIRVVKQVTG